MPAEQKNESNEMEQLAKEQAQDLAQAELDKLAAQEQSQRDALAAQMAKELENEESDSEPDFDPVKSFDEMTPEEEAAALQATKDLMETPEGAEYTATELINYYEEVLQEHAHEKFKITDKKKEIGTKRLTPIVQKYAPQMLGLFGQYKHEVMAALWVGSLAYGSIKQVKALKAIDAKAAKTKKEQTQEQQEAA